MYKIMNTFQSQCFTISTDSSMMLCHFTIPVLVSVCFYLLLSILINLPQNLLSGKALVFIKIKRKRDEEFPGHCSFLFVQRKASSSSHQNTTQSSASHDICITFTGAGYTHTKYPGNCQLYVKSLSVISNFKYQHVNQVITCLPMVTGQLKPLAALQTDNT